MIPTAVLAAALAMSGCAEWDAEAQARDSAREWLDCADVDLEAAGETAWHAAGCGRTVDVACTTSTNQPHCMRVRIASAGGEVATTASSGSAEPTIASPPSASPPVVDPVASSLRADLDARREDVLACASRDRVVLRTSWAADGSVTLALEGELAGAPEEGCVRAALSDLRVEATVPGTLLHLVRR